MDPKELRVNAPLSISVSDDSTKYAHSGPTIPTNKIKSYHEIGSTSMGKVDATAVRPCAIIGPDRVHPQNSGDLYLKKTPVESWPCTENAYRQPPDYPNRLSDYPPIRNISPRQTFQENMQRIMVPPTYSSIKTSDDSSLKNTKLNMPQDVKYCDVPYNMNPVTNEHKSVRNSDIPIPSVNPTFSRSVPHYGWHAGVNIRPPRPYGAPDIYQYPEYPSCVGPRPVTITHPNRAHRDEAQVYSERLYQEANIRFKPYPALKEKHQQTRYDYISNYQNTFHPPVTFPPHKYDLQKSLQAHPYQMYPQVPLKYLDRRIHETFVDGYQRSNQQPNFNPQFQNQVIHPPYGPISGNCVQNKSFTDLSAKPINSNKLPYETNNKIYLELDTSRNKGYPVPENVYFNDTNNAPHLRGDMLIPNRSTINMHSMPQHQVYRRDTLPMKHYEYNPHYRNVDPSLNLNYSLPRLPLQYSPNAIAISPSDSNTSNDTIHTIGTSQEDCGYVSQSSTNSVRSLDGVSASKDMYRRHDYNIHTIPRNLIGSDKLAKNKTNNSSSKKNIDVRQFLQMWNEGEDEANDTNKEIVTQIHPSNFSTPSKSKITDNQEQLYVLGLVNVPNEELSKYEHIQKISKLPENIKGYNSIELLNQYEELLESPNNNNYKVIPKVLKDHNSISKRPNDKENNTLPRPVSPLDVEAKISQSVIHKEVGCNFEIKPCSPEMLNADVATPIHSILGERIIEKVANPMISKSPILSRKDDNKVHNSDISNTKIASCDMINKQYPVNNYANITKNNNYNVQDFESNSGISLASLPRLDNDIELNFPEINQQFIKANKIETNVQLFQKNVTPLNLDQITHERTNSHNSLSPQFCLGSGPEKEFSKLSKYRKNKKCDTIQKEDTLERNTVTVQQRINSVIMKNPDTKLQDETDVSLSIPTKVSCKDMIDNNYNTEQDREIILSSIDPQTGGDKNMSFDTAIDFSLNKNEVVTSYDGLDKRTDEPHYFGDNNKVSIVSENVIDTEVISNEQPMGLHPEQINDKETFKENVIIHKELKEYSKIDENEYSASVTFKIPDELNIENNIPVIKNLSIITDVEEYANTQKNITCIIRQEEVSLLETSAILKSVYTENSENHDTVTATVTSSESKPNCSSEKKLQPTEDEYNIKPKKKNLRDNIINQKVEKFDNGDENNESNKNCEISNKFNDVKHILNEKELLIVNEKDVNLYNTTENTVAEPTLSDIVENKIDKKIFDAGTGSNQDLELSEVLYKIEKVDKKCSKEENILELSVNVGTMELETIENKIEKGKTKQFNYTKSFPTDERTSNNQLEIINKTSGNDSQCSDIDATSDFNFNVCNQEIHKFDVKSPISEIYESNSNKCETFNRDALESSTIEHSERTQDKNGDSKHIITSAQYKVESLESNYNLSTCKEKENTTNKLDPKFNLSKTTDILIIKEKYTNTAKELYSPWIQKLIIFREGVCENIQNNVLKATQKTVTKEDAVFRNEVKILNEDFKKQDIDIETNNIQNISIISENPTNEDQSCCDLIISQQIGEYSQNLLTKDVGICPEDDKKDRVEESHSITVTTDCASPIRRNVLKRSLSESALEDYKDEENIELFPPNKRKKRNANNIVTHSVISEDLCRIIQTNRRNSISTFYNEDNVFILIDNDLIITEENDDSDKMYYTEMSHEFSNNIPQNNCTVDDITTLPIDNEITSAESTLICEEKSVEESWVEDVACIETVVSDDITDDIDYEIMSQKMHNLNDETISEQSTMFCDNKHIEIIKNTYGNNMCSNDTQILQTLYMTPQMNVNKTLLDIESRSAKTQENDETIDPPCENNDSLDNLNDILSSNSCEVINEKENINTKDTTVTKVCQSEETNSKVFVYVTNDYNQEKEKCIVHSISCESNKDYDIQSPKNTISNYSNSSSPEVSSTTPEEKNSSILLKITNHNGSRISKVNEIGSLDRLSYKLTEKKDYHNYNSNFCSSRTLITKAAQKYIPPLKETMRDLKIQLTLPQHRLHSLKQLKVSKVEPKIDDNIIKYINKKSKQEIPKKTKPKFEDVLKSIDEIQFKKHKDKIKKGKNDIPKVVIKKNENGAHFTSCRSINDKDTYNPDLTGRKWQPWVFLEKNNFIDKMAIKNKVKAVYCHRKKNYVLAEKFRKYKSIFNANFVISQPSLDNSSKGTLKYTIKLKHK